MPTLILPVPPTTNHAYGINGGRMYKTAKSREWEEEAIQQIRYVHKVRTTLTGNLYCSIFMFYKFDRDIDSCLKIILDVLQKSRVLVNDKQIVFLNVQKFKDQKNPRIEVELRRINASGK